MTTLAAHVRAPLGKGLHAAHLAAACAVLLAGSLATGWLAAEPTTVRYGMLAVGCAVALGVGVTAPRALLLALVLWLPVLGLLRRIVELNLSPASGDLLLLFAPFCLGALALIAAGQGAFRHPTALTKTVFVLGVLMVLGALNPLEQNARAGAAGLLLLLVPTLAFWVGRIFCDDALVRRILFITAGAAVAAALYGIAQTFAGFPRWDSHWIDTSGYASLQVGGAIRPFASFASAAEYGYFLAIAIVVWCAFGLRKRRILVALPVIALLAVALALESSRGVVVTLIVALGLMVAARAGLRLPAALGLVCLVLLTIVLGLRMVVSGSEGDGHRALLGHQLAGLAFPLDPEHSTARGHASLVATGIKSAFSDPVGIGDGAVTIAGRRYGSRVFHTEADPGNVAVALGLPGLVCYFVLVVVIARRVFGQASLRRDALSIAALGLVAVTSLQWLTGAQYAVAYLPWLMLGWLDRPQAMATE
jgi:hypothetical protein